MMFDDDDLGLALQECEMHIVLGILEDGTRAISAKFTNTGSDELIAYFTGLGMLEAAKVEFIRRWDIGDA